MLKLLLILQIFILFFASPCWSQGAKASYRFNSIYFAHDKERSLHPLSGSMEGFEKLTDPHIHTSYSSGLVWLRGVFDQTFNDDDSFLVLTSPLTGKITLYLEDASAPEGWSKQAVSGSALRWEDRSAPSYLGAFKLAPQTISVGQEFLIKREGHHLLDGSLMLMNRAQFEEFQTNRTNVLLFYAGAAFALILYNLFLFIYGKDKVYGLYLLFVLSMVGIAFTVTGAADYFFPVPFIPSEYLLLFSSSACFLAIFFSRKFVDFPRYAPALDRWVKRAAIFPALTFFIYLFFNSSVVVRANLGVVIDIIIILELVLLVSVSVYAHIKGSPMAKFYLCSWCVLVAGVFLYEAGVHGLLANSLVTQWGILMGNLGEMLLLSLALAYRMTYIEAQKKEMELKAKDKDRYQRLVRVLCHDISNPLFVIKNYAMLMGRKRDYGVEFSRSIAGKISRASSIIEELITRVRNYEALEQERKLTLGPVDLGEVLSEANFLVGQKLEQKNIELHIKEEDTHVRVCAERSSLLNNVLMNLLTNAIKFSPVDSKIKISTIISSEEVTLIVKDEGCGMSREQLSNFISHGQVEVRRGTAGESGTGLGMSLMKSYMDLYEGQLHIDSKAVADFGDESGTEVTLIFKRA